MQSSLLFVISLFISQLSIAAPSAFTSQCGPLKIVNQTTSTILSDNKDCKTAWVLPPTYGVASLSGYMMNGNLGMCQEVKEVQNLSLHIVKKIATLTEELAGKTVEYKKREEDLLRAEAEIYDVEQSPEIREIANIELQINVVERDITALIDKLAICSANCVELREELRSKREENIKLKIQLQDRKAQYFELVRQHRLAKAKRDSAKSAFDNVCDEVDKKSERLITLKGTMQNWLMFYSKLEGGTAHVDYDTQWVQNMATLNQKYRGQYDFKQIPTRNARINAHFVGSNDRDTYLSSMPAILDYSINGVKFIPWGASGPIEQTSMPSRISGSVRLSLMGGCPMYYKNFLDSETLVKDENLSNKQMNFALSATYEYPAAFKFNVKAKYNLYKMYQSISTATSHSGFFSQKDYEDLLERQSDSDAFTIVWDNESEYNDEQQKEITKTLKTELMGRVLTTLATPMSSNNHLANAKVPTGTGHGALVVAEGLSQTCGYFNLFCQGAVWVFRALDASFGSSTAENKFRQDHDRTAEEVWDVSQTRWRAAATGFVAN